MPTALLVLLLCFPYAVSAQAIDSFYVDHVTRKQIFVVEYADGRSVGHWTESGYLAKVSHKGVFNGCRMPVGTDSFFADNPGGVLESTIRYEHYASDTPSDGCHSTWTITTLSTFDVSGRLKAVEQHKSGYETHDCPCGEWEEYDSNGKIVRSKRHPSCFARTLECSEFD